MTFIHAARYIFLSSVHKKVLQSNLSQKALEAVDRIAALDPTTDAYKILGILSQFDKTERQQINQLVQRKRKASNLSVEDKTLITPTSERKQSTPLSQGVNPISQDKLPDTFVGDTNVSELAREWLELKTTQEQDEFLTQYPRLETQIRQEIAKINAFNDLRERRGRSQK